MASPAKAASTPRPTNGVSADSTSQSAPTLAIPLTSLSDDGSGKRPRDTRLLHVLLTRQGVSAYQERVPLQLLDYAYRYTSSVLNDAVHLSQEGYGQPASGTGGRGAHGVNDLSNVNMQQLRLSIATRQTVQLPQDLPKEYLLDMAQERNRVALPQVPRESGLSLPPEKYCLTGIGWGLEEEWESEGEAEDAGAILQADSTGIDRMEDDGDGEEEGGGRMEDVFGEQGEDRDMPDA
ncbi:MAG: Transcription initiation factor TFIID subunit 9 [Vezdaea aestivalis]|nr:MAG: Transcription initiation factor TFIID subunit 9 [Vezdaea aestivalis]